MRKEDTVRLDTHALVGRIEDGGVKQAWLAERVGVSRKTVSRWVTGKVKRIGRESAEALAEVLGCAVEALTVADEVDVLATKAEQRAAARLIQDNDLLQLLSPSDNWALAESLIKATLQPDLPLRELGRLYNLLSIAAWRQGHYDEAVRRLERAEEIGVQLDDGGLRQGATYNRAVVDSLVGDMGAALAGYERCLEHPEWFESPRDHAKVLSNVGDTYRSVRRYPESVAAQEECLRIFRRLGAELNVAIGEVSLGNVLCEQGRFDAAEAAYERGEEAAGRANYARGVDCGPIYRADPCSLRGEVARARGWVEEGLPRLRRHPVYDLGCHTIAARVLRRAEAWDDAAAQVREGVRRAEGFPEVRGMLHLEGARLAQARGDGAGAAASRRAANAAFRAAGLEVRVVEGAVPEHGVALSGGRRIRRGR